MNLQELILQVNRDVDDIFENGDIQHWLNRALDDITPIARSEKRVVLQYPYTLPNDVQDMERVMQTNKIFPRIPVGEQYQQGYWVWGNELVIQGGNQQPIEVYYYKKLCHLKGMDDVPEIDSPYHDLLILYAVGQLQFMDGDYGDRPDSMQRYEQRRQQYAVFREKRKVKRSSVRMKTIHEYMDAPTFLADGKE
ncbi:hypothetical protein M3Y14_04175 [Bacillus thuringiensis]|uniref:phage adaptor protein n=1 Tax=Bacillus thuringiensis TaxID=1428 RepID=UPI0022255765|nr:hypothetical protein [Bacillus thuringiensis]UYX53358.1 hypothetical protein M3Y14_04175 [Bacillus thuringiensis]